MNGPIQKRQGAQNVAIVPITFKRNVNNDSPTILVQPVCARAVHQRMQFLTWMATVRNAANCLTSIKSMMSFFVVSTTNDYCPTNCRQTFCSSKLSHGGLHTNSPTQNYGVMPRQMK